MRSPLGHDTQPVRQLLVIVLCSLTAPSFALASPAVRESGGTPTSPAECTAGCHAWVDATQFSAELASGSPLQALPTPRFAYTERHVRTRAGKRLVLSTFTVSGLMPGEGVALAREIDRVAIGRIHLHAQPGAVTFTNVNEIVNAFARERVRVRFSHWLSRVMTVIMPRGAPRSAYEIEDEHCLAPEPALEAEWEFDESYTPC